MAELNISERQVGDVTILDMDGKITIGEGSVALRTAIRRLLEEGKKKILLNLDRVSYIDSSGIGELVASYSSIDKEGAVAFRNSIRGLIDGGKKKILLNLGGVKNIDSSGIGELIANYTTLSRDGGELKLLNLTEKIQNLLVITKLLTVFDSFENEAE